MMKFNQLGASLAVVAVLGVGANAWAGAYTTNTVINSAVSDAGHSIGSGAVVEVVSGGSLTATNGHIIDGAGGGTLIVSGTGTVTVDDCCGNLYLGDGSGNPMTLTAQDNAVVSGTLVAGPRDFATINISDNALIDAVGLFRLGWPGALGGANPGVEINQNGGTIDGSDDTEINVAFLNSLDWNFAGGTILLEGDWTDSGQDILGQSWFHDTAIGTTAIFSNGVTTVSGEIPEPASIALLGLGGLMMLRRRH